MTPPGTVTELTDASFNDFLARNRLCVVDFWGAGCVYCRPMSRVVEEVASELAGTVAFASVNIDDHHLNASRLGVQALPTNIVFRNGEPVDSIQGLVPKQRFVERLRSRLDL